jgi:uncharacterized membrane protein
VRLHSLVILKAEGRDSLLVRWQYGLGRACVFASDAKSRWAKRRVGWEGYDRFWANVWSFPVILVAHAAIVTR